MGQPNNASPAIIDANIWIALFHRTDTLHKQAVGIMQLLEENAIPLILPTFIIQEVMTVLLYKKQSRLIDVWFEFIETNHVKILHTDDETPQRTHQMMKAKKYTPKLSYTDWYLFTLSRDQHWPVVTLDKQLDGLLRK